jgi:hypothetical protein
VLLQVQVLRESRDQGRQEAAAKAPAADHRDKISSHRRWSHTKELATSWHGRPLWIEQRQALGVVGGLLDPHLPPAGGQTQHGVSTSALFECGSGAPQMGAPRGPCKSNHPAKKKQRC